MCGTRLTPSSRASVSSERAVYLSFDDDRLADIGADQLDELFEEHYRRFPRLRGRETVSWFLDEIQLVAGWDRFVRRVLDTEKVELVVSGSSAKLLSREVHSSLRGRAMATVIRPFSFREFLRHRGDEPAKAASRMTAGERSGIEKSLREYLRCGGFPEAQGLDQPTRVELLQGYVDTVLFRDIVERHRVSQVAGLRWIVRHALRNPCGSFSAKRLYDDLRSQGHAVAKDTVHALLDHVFDAFLFGAAAVATESERRRNTNPRKLYPVDHALIDAFDTSGRPNTGHILETAVFNELARRGAEVAYVKTQDGCEVDFLARGADGREELIQICADPAEPSTWRREVDALESAAKEHPRASRRVVVLEAGTLTRERPPRVEVTPAYAWFLGAE